MKELKYYGGNGVSSCEPYGKFEIKYDNANVKEFTVLSEAVDFYNSLNCEKALWDITYIPELIEAHFYPKDKNNHPKLAKRIRVSKEDAGNKELIDHIINKWHVL